VLELAAPFDMTPRAVSKHLAVLEAAGLVERGRAAQRRPARLRSEPLVHIDRWLNDYRSLWEDRFDRLNERLNEQQERQNAKGKKA